MPRPSDPPLIETPPELEALCRHLEGAELVALDTEFVSERTFRPQLCLIQVAVGERTAAIDPLAVDVAPFWQAVAGGSHRTLVHGGREELLFCLRSAGRRPAGLVDLQVAAALVGHHYPVGYANLVSRVLGIAPAHGETRSDWSRRPLSSSQLRYAIDDVVHLVPLYERLRDRLTELGRGPWLAEEMAAWQEEIEADGGGERWRRVKGGTSLPRRGLAVLRELWHWRRDRASRLDRPVQRVMRDDLLVELARRRSADVERIRSVRGLDRGPLRAEVPELAAAVARGLAVPAEELPSSRGRREAPAAKEVTQLLALGLAGLCRQEEVAPVLVGTAADLQELVEARLSGAQAGEPPRLSRGWRGELVGRALDELLEGRRALRIADPRAEQPVAFETWPPAVLD